MSTEAQKKASRKYDQEHTVSVLIKFNKKTDKDIIEKLDQVSSKQGYIKQLIRSDIKPD